MERLSLAHFARKSPYFSFFSACKELYRRLTSLATKFSNTMPLVSMKFAQDLVTVASRTPFVSRTFSVNVYLSSYLQNILVVEKNAIIYKVNFSNWNKKRETAKWAWHTFSFRSWLAMSSSSSRLFALSQRRCPFRRRSCTASECPWARNKWPRSQSTPACGWNCDNKNEIEYLARQSQSDVCVQCIPGLWKWIAIVPA